MIRILFLSIMVIAAACSSKKSSSAISQDKMRLVIWDLARADEMASVKKNADSTVNVKEYSFTLYEQVFSIHQTTREEFYKSLRYYQEHPLQLKTILDSVARLAEKKTEPKIAPVKDH